jgi:hypothetical protein
LEKQVELLIIEDSAEDAHLISRILREDKVGINYHMLPDGEQASDVPKFRKIRFANFPNIGSR